ncbi:MAG: hypothetical protein EA379_00845 [Phycisphaerales bacterium]|nr:MAG: hypothetical protein EA379_00845 [Phycisphaerales bacterium]
MTKNDLSAGLDIHETVADGGRSVAEIIAAVEENLAAMSARDLLLAALQTSEEDFDRAADVTHAIRAAFLHHIRQTLVQLPLAGDEGLDETFVSFDLPGHSVYVLLFNQSAAPGRTDSRLYHVYVFDKDGDSMFDTFRLLIMDYGVGDLVALLRSLFLCDDADGPR